MFNMKDLIGKRIMAIRPIGKDELELQGWDYTHSATAVILLEGGILLYPSQDDEGNGPGTLFVQDTKGQSYIVWDKKVIM